MKIQFDKSQQSQSSVSQAQLRTRSGKHQKTPVFQVLILLLVIGGIGFGVYQYIRMQNVYAYGIVAGRTEFVTAPRLGTIEGLQLQRGYHVKKGDLMFTFQPEASEAERQAEQRVIETLTEARATAATEQTNRVEQAASDVDRLQDRYDEELAKRAHDVAMGEAEVAKLTDFYEEKKKRLEQYKQLLALDAAVNSNVEGAANEVRLAYHNLEQARIDLRLAESRSLPSAAELEKAKLELSRLQGAEVPPELKLDQAKFELDFASKLRDPIEYRAPFDGVVLDVHTSEGSIVTDGAPVITVAATGGVWVDAYLPSKKALDVQVGQAAHMYVPGRPDPLVGQVAVEMGAAVRVPEILRESMPRVHTAVLTRIDMSETEGLYPGTIVQLVFRNGNSAL